MTRKRKIALWVIVAAVAVPVAVLATIRLIAGPKVAVVQVHRGPIVQTVVASGHVMSTSRVAVGSLVSGTVDQVKVDEGSLVKKGDLLVTIDDQEAQANLDQALASLGQARARLSQLRQVQSPVAKATLDEAKLALERARLAYQRAQRLRKAGSVSQSQLDEARLAYQQAKAHATIATAQAAGSAAGGSDSRLAVAAVKAAQAAVVAAKARLAHSRLTAPVDGVVVARMVEPGDSVQPGKALLRLDKAGDTLLVVNTDEKNLRFLRVGEPAVASADAFPQRTFEAKVTRIAPAVDPDRGTVEVRLTVKDPPAYLRPDMTVSVNIETARKPDALVVPAEAVRDLTSDAPWVLLVQDGRTAKVPVKLGIVGDREVEIASGVSAGARLVPATDGKVQPGAKVRTTTVPAKTAEASEGGA